MTVHWISCKAWTAHAVSDERGIVIEAAPIIGRFVGQPVLNLLAWAAKLGGLRHEEYEKS